MDPAKIKPLTAADVKNATGLSYRQLNDWDSKGALPSQREDGSSWRRYTWLEIFVLMICTEIRKRFGTSLDSLAWIQKCMLQDPAKVDHLRAAIAIMERGMAVFLFSDLRETFVMESDVAFESMFRAGMMRGSEDQGFIFVQLNHIVNRLLQCLEPPVALRLHNKFYGAIAQAKAETTARDEAERTVLCAIRDRDYQRVVVTKKNGDDIILKMQQELSEKESANAHIDSLLAQHDFQTITVSRVAGKNVRVERTVPLPLKRKQRGGIGQAVKIK
jgi:hypothetical protein